MRCRTCDKTWWAPRCLHQDVRLRERVRSPLSSSLALARLSVLSCSFLYSGARGPPQFLKKRSENEGANENLSGGFAAIPGIAPRVAPRIVGFVLIKS